jgi:hypothetical protein
MTWPWLKLQPLCQACWENLHPHGDQPSRRPFAERHVERCCICGRETLAGIYALYRPAAVPYPTQERP